jgi:two-component system chemotaxis sensor kinase CheA
MDDLLQEFLAETAESLASLDVELVKLEQNPGDANILGNIFRLVHTIKGTCGFLGLPRLERVAHAGEDVLGKFRDGSLAVTPAAVSLILKCLDRIRILLAALETTGSEPEGDDTDLIARLRAYIADGGEAAADEPAPVPVAAPAPAPVAEIPVAEEIRPEPVAARTPPVEASPDHDEPVQSRPAAATAEGADAGAAPATVAAVDSTAAAQSIRVSVDVLESLMTLVSELVLTRNQLLQMFRGKDEIKLAEPVQRLSLITSELQEGVMKTRMQPIGNAWAKLPRIIRDLSVETGKKFNLRMLGGDTELDRQVLELIKDPLTHMVRNSADHGIERPEERRAAAKPEAGTITLNAYHEGGHIIIEIGDDGRGLNLARIRRKAVEKGLVSPDEVERLSDQQVQQFIFRAGFSTAEKVTSVSGRGVGMDVVRTNIERIGGTIELKSTEGHGTTVTIKIPLTLAIVSALIVGCGEQRFAVPQISVRELVHVSPKSQNALELVNGTPVLRLRNQLLPLVALQGLLSLGEERDLATDTFFVVVTQVGARDFGIVVDQVLDTEEIVIKPVARMLRKIPFYSGNTILGDGSVIMILDPNGIATVVGQSAVSATEAIAATIKETSDRTTALIVFQAGDEARKAVPMSLVARLEDIDMASVEYVNGQYVYQYRGHLMPLVSVDPNHQWRREGRSPLLVFSERDRSVGLIVDRILDIIEDQVQIELGSGREGVLGSAIIDGKATDLIDIAPYLTRAFSDWFGTAESLISETARSGKHLMLVDDSPFFLSLMEPYLSARGFEITTARSAEEAIQLLDGGKPIDAIISDIEMPGMNGFEFARAVHGDPRWRTLPMIALSAWATEQSMALGREAGFLDFVPKARREGVLQAVDRMFSKYGEAA